MAHTDRPGDTPVALMNARSASGSTRALNSSQSTSSLWAYQHNIDVDFGLPGEPTGNAAAESFNVRVRAEYLHANRFLSLVDAQLKCEACRRDYKA